MGLREKIRNIYAIAADLETMFPGRKSGSPGVGLVLLRYFGDRWLVLVVHTRVGSLSREITTIHGARENAYMRVPHSAHSAIRA